MPCSDLIKSLYDHIYAQKIFYAASLRCSVDFIVIDLSYGRWMIEYQPSRQLLIAHGPIARNKVTGAIVCSNWTIYKGLISDPNCLQNIITAIESDMRSVQLAIVKNV